MIRFELEQSDTEIYSAHGGLALVGQLINRYSGLKQRLKSIPLRHGIPHYDLFRVYLGLLCTGKNDFEAVDGVRYDRFFRQALGIGQMPSSARLRQRFDAQAQEYIWAADDTLVPLLRHLKAPVTAEPSSHVALHANVFCPDNGKTRKEWVGRPLIDDTDAHVVWARRPMAALVPNGRQPSYFRFLSSDACHRSG